MKLTLISNFPLQEPMEADYAAIEQELGKLLSPLNDQLSIKFIKRLRKCLGLLILPKHCFLLQEDEVPVGVYFIVMGTVLVGAEPGGGVRLNHILRTGDFVLPLSLFSGERSRMGMKTAEPVRLLFMESQIYHHLLKKFPQAVTLTNLWRDKLEGDAYSRKLVLNEMTALERMNWLYQKWPDCFTVFSDEWIASYLELTRETVNRNKLKVIKGKKM